MSEDRSLFDDRMLEGEYTTWNFLWTRNMGAGETCQQLCVDNFGTVYVIKEVFVGHWTITRGNVLTYLANYKFRILLGTGHDQAWSVTRKYVLALKTTAPTAIVVYRYGALIFSVLTSAFGLDVGALVAISMSANGKYIALISRSIATGNRQYVTLLEGT
jgi:hypothetical protein